MNHVLTPRRSATSRIRRPAVTVLVTALLTLLLATSATASASEMQTTSTVSVQTTTVGTSMAGYILSWLNRDRVAAGLRPLRAWASLESIANRRAASMAAAHTATHAAAGGDPGVALRNAGVQYFSWGEIVGWSSYLWGSQAAANLYSMWKGSPYHHAIMFSATSNYIGVGIARADNGATYASVMFTESVDHTRPIARNRSLSYYGTTIRFGWSGADVLLQTHTAGLRSFDVQYRVDNGPWRLLRNDTTATSLRLYNRAHRHYYSFRVQSADRRGNLSAWTAVKRIWLP